MSYLIIANWKMAVDRRVSVAFAKKLRTWKKNPAVQLMVAPSAIALESVARLLPKSISVAAQDCSAFTAGAHTGDVDAADVYSVGARAVILGHSERRMLLGETNELVAAKVGQAWGTGLLPIVCIGEVARSKNSDWRKKIQTQLVASLPAAVAGPLVVAYEPVWAIGTGAVVTPEDLEEAITVISQTMTRQYGAAWVKKSLKIVYGGSVSAKTITPLAAVSGVDGFLVGGASQTISTLRALMEALK